MYLAINTALPKNCIALIDANNAVWGKSWTVRADEAKKLFSNLHKLISGDKLKFEKLKGIVVVTGPGPFSGVRIGVTTANIIAALHELPIFTLDLIALKQLQEKCATRTFAQTIMAFLKSKPKKQKIAKPFYSKPPNITKSKKCKPECFKF